MTKLSEEIRQADDQRRDQILNFVSHQDLKKEFVLLIEEQGKVDAVVAYKKERENSEVLKPNEPLIDNVEPLKEKKPKKRGRPSKQNIE